MKGKRGYRSRSKSRPRKRYSRRRGGIAKGPKAYKYHAVRARFVFGVTVANGATQSDTVFHWYYDFQRRLPSIWGQEVMVAARNNYDSFRPVGMKLKWIPSYGTVQDKVTSMYMVSDSNSDLIVAPLSNADAIQHRYSNQIKPGTSFKKYFNFLKHARGLGVDWCKTEGLGVVGNDIAPDPIWSNSSPQKRTVGSTQFSVELSAPAVPANGERIGVFVADYYFHFKDRKNYG